LIGAAFLLLCRPNTSAKKEILVLSIITLAAAASRVLLEPLANVQPLTMMCLVMGGVLGARRGMAFALMATLISNAILSNGWWTLFQATGWAAAAFAGSKLALVIDGEIQMKRLLLSAAVASVLFDWWVSLSVWHSGMGLGEFALYLLNGLPFDALHVIASLTFSVWLAQHLADLIHQQVSLDLNENPVVSPDVRPN
jgi:hypothetical protein